MQKKFILGLLLFSIFSVLGFTYAFATDGKDAMGEAANSVRNVVGDAENGIENAAKDISNTSKNATGDMENAANGMTNNGVSFMTSDSNSGNYTARRTATTDTTLLGMNSTTWIWLILAIAAVAIVALVYYYTTSVSNRNSYKDNND